MRLGEVRFALVHHSACADTGFHYRIAPSGETETCASESERVGRAHCIEILVEGDFSEQRPGDPQLEALRALLLSLKQRYPRIAVGGHRPSSSAIPASRSAAGHRQVRGEKTTCPGRRSSRSWTTDPRQVV